MDFSRYPLSGKYYGGNWGFVKEKYRIAPVFDNGSCLFPNLINEKDMINIINSEEDLIFQPLR